MTLIERLRFAGGVGDEAADLLESQAARIAELEAALQIAKHNEQCTHAANVNLCKELAALRRKIDEAPVVAWLCEGKDIYGEYYCYVVSATPPDQDHVTIKPLISKEDLA